MIKPWRCNMKQRLLLSVATGVMVAASWALSAVACEDKATTADAATAVKSKVCTAEMAAKCTPEQAAACKAKGASAVTASAGGMCSHGAAVTAAAGACSHGAAATAAAGACPHGIGASAKASGNRKYDAAVTGGYSCGGRGMSAMADHFSHGDCDACGGMSA